MLAVKPKIPGGRLIRPGKGVIWAGERTIKGDQGLQCRLIIFVILKYKTIIKTNLNLIVLIWETFYLK